MFKQLFSFTQSNLINYLIQFAIAVLILCLGGPVVISYGNTIPFPILEGLVVLIAVWFGWQVGFMATLFYIILGTLGLPVFPDHKFGFEYVFSLTNCGYFFGYLAAALISGVLVEIPHKWKLTVTAVSILFGHLLILLLGFFYLYRVAPERALEYVKLDMEPYGMNAAAVVILTVFLLRMVKGREKFFDKQA